MMDSQDSKIYYFKPYMSKGLKPGHPHHLETWKKETQAREELIKYRLERLRSKKRDRYYAMLMGTILTLLIVVYFIRCI